LSFFAYFIRIGIQLITGGPLVWKSGISVKIKEISRKKSYQG